MITTTLNRIKEHEPCENGWRKLLKGLGKTTADDEPLPFSRIFEINGFDDALWCCRVEPQYAKQWRLFAVWCARKVEHLMSSPSKKVLEVAERYANGLASFKELADAREAAWDAGMGDAGMGDAGMGATKYIATRDIAREAAWSAAMDAALDASRAAHAASRAAVMAASRAGGTGARAAAWDAQCKKFLEIVTTTETETDA